MVTSEPLDEIVLDACRQFGPSTALSSDRIRITYGELATKVGERAAAIDRACAASPGSPRDRVGVHARNTVDYVLSYLAVLHTGRVPLLIDAAFGAQELEEIRTGCGVTAFVVDRESADQFPLDGVVTPIDGSGHALVTVAAGAEVPAMRADTAVCRFTSGTTGVPKALEFSAFAVHSAARNWVAGTGMSDADRTLCLAAFTNGLAFNTSLLSSFLVGAELYVYSGLPTSAKIVQALRSSRATRMVAFPMVYEVLVDSAVDAEAFAGLEMAISAGAPLKPKVRTEFEHRYRVRIADYYGVAEAGPCTFERDPCYRQGLGTPLPGVILRLAANSTDQSEIALHTTSMATAYLNAPGQLESRIDAEGYYATGDLGYLKDGRLFISGRVGGPINLAGRKVDPHEIELTVKDIEGVRDCVVFADQDSDDRVFLHLAVATAKPLDRTDVVAGCRGRIADYKIPQRVSFVAEIPRSSAGKVRLTDLRRLLARPATTAGRVG